MILGVDVGSSGCKVAAFDLGGTLVATAHRSYPLRTPRPGWRELDAEEVLGRVMDCLAEVCSDGVGARVVAVAVSSQGEAVIPIDRTGRALAPVQVSFDIRSAAVCDEVFERLDGPALRATTGTPRHPMFSLYKLLWLRENQPDVYARTCKVATFADWVAHRLGADLVMDHTLASRTAMFDVGRSEWSEWILTGAGIDRGLLPELAPPGTAIGTVSPGVASQLGLSPRVVIGTGGHDQICCALGAGVVAEGEAMNSMGTTDSIVCLTPSAAGAGALAGAGLACGASALDAFAVHAFVLSTGSVAAWFRKTWNTADAPLDELAERAWALGGPSGISFLPHMSGSGTPHLDEQSFGVIAGLTLESTPEQVYRAILEGICLELAENMRHMARSGARIDSLRAIGGAARSDHYLQIKSDIYGLPIARPRVTEAGCLGAALLAGHAAGLVASLADQARNVAHIEASFEPDRARHDAYAEMAERHARLYPLVRALRGAPD